MLDLRSPRLVGQALYEHIRWSRRCIVDWTEWRANVFFEFGVRLAGSSHDPLVVIDRTDLPDEGVDPGTGLRQRALLAALFAPLRYERDDPYDALEGPLDAWRNARAGSSWGMPGAALPPASTFSVAQQSYVWTDDDALRAPDVEQQAGVERIFGRDQYRRPESLVLFAHNAHFDARLRDAVREKWIAAWLYLRHLTSVGPVETADGRLLSTARLARRALTGSEVPRHVAVREEISQFLRDNRRSRRIATDDAVLGLKASAMDARSEGDWEGAIEDLDEAVNIVLQRLPAGGGASRPPDALAQLADLYGAIGGIERRWGLALAPDDRAVHLQASVDAYDEGFSYEKEHLGANNDTTYTRLNRLVARVLVDSSVLVGDVREAMDVRRELAEVERVVQKQLDSTRANDPWAWCDLALVRLLRDEPVDDALAVLEGLQPKRLVYESALGTWRPLADVAGDVRPELHDAVERLEDAARYAPTSSG
jgi:hypothetical protein